MRKSICCVLLATLVAILPVATLLCSCSKSTSKDMSASAQTTQIAQPQQSTPAPAVETKSEPAPTPAPAPVAEPVAENTAVAVVPAPVPAPVVEKTAPAEPVVKEKSAPVESAPAQETTPVSEPAPEPAPAEPAPKAEQPVATPAPVEPTSAPAAEPVVTELAATSTEESSPVAEELDRSGHIITLGLSPWGWQHFYIDKSGIDAKNSTYGLGGKLAYTYLFNCGFYAGAEAAFETYFIDHKDNFNDIMFFIDGGYDFDLTERFGLNIGLGAGLELECYDSKCSAVGVFKADLGFGYSLSEHFIIGAGCDFIFGFPVKSSTNYMEFQIIPCITASYKF